SNVGHLVIAAGAAGVIKTALALRDEVLPASLHFTAANANLRLEATAFTVNGASTPWARAALPRRAGVSSFGVGGTNAHVVLEEAPLRAASDRLDRPVVLPLSARTPAALQASAERLAAHLEAHPQSNLADVAHTLRVGRKAFAERA